MKQVVRIAALAATLLLASCMGTVSSIPTGGSSAPSMIVWLFYGAGGATTSPGIDQEAATLAAIPGVEVRGPFFWDSWQSVEADIAAAPKAAKKALVGYSCGNESVTAIPAALPSVIFSAVIGVQASLYCPPVALTPNILKVQETYNSVCVETGGLGCAHYQPGPGFPASRLTVIDRPDSHGEADLDPDWQNDATAAIKAAMAAPLSARFKAASSNLPRFLILHHSERAH